MLNAALYLTTVLIWGSTWLAIKYQIGEVPPIQSILYRFAIAAFLLQGFVLVTGRFTWFDRRAHLLFLALGAFLFSMNYLLYYIAVELGLTTGLEAVIFSFLIVLNIVNAWILFGERPQGVVVIGAAFGLIGVGMLFRNELQDVLTGTTIGIAVLLSVGATYLASLGNMASRALQARKVDVVSANAWGMTYGTGILLVGSLVTTDAFVFSATPTYIGCLLFLAVFGTIIAFGAYLTLLGRIGSARASYATIVFPIIALILSTIFENYEWSALKTAGVAMIASGNLILLGRFPKFLRPEPAGDS
ncbi:MAG: EamA family transporter [Gammaproteobacteria bacterium]|nr:MAG: EamA family transporter [Gammaproteobacteria bacterium]